VLILTRRVGESIVIGDDVVVTIVEAGRDAVRIGIDAPRHITVHRHEVYAAIARENEAARSADGGHGPTERSQVSAASLTAATRRAHRPGS
jgi:carbon storage regulator